MARVGRAAIYTLIPLSLLFALAAGLLVVRLRHGPIELGMLVPPIERGINAELSKNSVDIGGAELRLGESGGFEFRLREITVFENARDAVAVAPLAAVTLSTSGLWSGRIVPERIELIDPEISFAYTDDGGLVLDPPQVRRVEPTPRQPGDAEPTIAVAPADAPLPPVEFNLAKILSESSRSARRREGATSFLTEFGIRNATVVVAYAGKKSAWKVPEASVDFQHAKRRSVISGRAIVDSQQGPWSFTFRTDESEKTDKLLVKATVRDLVPATLAAAAPPLALLKPLVMPMAGDATIALSTNGDIDSAELALEIGAGRIVHADLARPFEIGGGLFRLAYDGKAREWQLAPSPIKWAGGSMLFTGAMRDSAQSAGEPASWRFVVDGKNGVFEAPEFAVASVPVDVWRADGAIVPRKGLVSVNEFKINAGGGEAILKAVTQASATRQSTDATVTLSAMPLATLKALWPSALASGARTWVGESVSEASFKGGTVRYQSGDFAVRDGATGEGPIERLTATFEVDDTSIVPLPGMSPIRAPRGLVQIVDNALDVTIPEASLVMAADRRVPLKSIRLTAPDVMIERPESQLSFATQGSLGPFIEAIEQLPVRAVREASPLPKAADGKVDGQFTLTIPLVSNLDEDEVRIEGKAKISDGRFGKVAGRFDIQGFTLALDLTATQLDAKGDLIVNGVPAKIMGQRVFGTDAASQPPVRVQADLDETDRKQLGLDVGDIIQGVVPVQVTLTRNSGPEPAINVQADLTNAEISLPALGWKKAAGRRATLATDIVTNKPQRTELQNFKVSGDDIAIDGWIALGADQKTREFHFPTFTLNVVSQLEVQGNRASDNSWSIKANGKTFDGRDLFRSLFSVDNSSAKAAKGGEPDSGFNISADIGNVLGASDVSLRGVKLKLSSRGDKLAALDMRGTLDGGAPLTAILDQSSGRKLLIRSDDAGQVMRLMDFYPNMQGGRLGLTVDLDGRGAADKTGVLTVEDFRILGDAVVSEVVSSADQGGSTAKRKGSVTREVFEFDKMRAPFSIGYGQFVLENSIMKGPLVGATMRGKVDFKTRRVNIGGTYIPLQGLNGMLGGIPVLGQLISGVQGEGIFGITFAVQGALSNPEVLVNPLSLVTPGIFRDIFQMTSANPSVQVREDKAPAAPVSERVRASTPPDGTSAAPPRKEKTVRAKPADTDGWSSKTLPGSAQE